MPSATVLVLIAAQNAPHSTLHQHFLMVQLLAAFAIMVKHDWLLELPPFPVPKQRALFVIPTVIRLVLVAKALQPVVALNVLLFIMPLLGMLLQVLLPVHYVRTVKQERQPEQTF